MGRVGSREGGGAGPPRPGYFCFVARPFISSGITLSTADSPPPERESWADAIESAAAHVRNENSGTGQERYEDGPRRGRKVLLVIAGVLVAAGVAFGVQEVARSSSEPLPMASQAADLRLEAASLIEQIEAYRSERGELPEPSLLHPFLEEGYEYHVVNEAEGRYLVRRTAGGVTVTYDGSLPLGLWVVVGGGSAGSSS